MAGASPRLHSLFSRLSLTGGSRYKLACKQVVFPSLSSSLSSRVLTNTNNVTLMSTAATTTAAAGKGEIVTFLGLNNLSDNPGAVKKGRRIGRGIGSSKGKTSGRGHKGQKARAGSGVSPLFEGGQTKFYKRIPKRGFTNVHAEPMVPLNIGTLQDYIDMGRFGDKLKKDGTGTGTGGSPVVLTMKDLVEAGFAKTNAIRHGIKLLAKGADRLRTPVRIEVSRASSAAIRAVEKVGGEVTAVHYNKLALRALLKPHKFPGGILPKRARPPPKWMPYYTDWENRGYLSPEAQMKLVRDRLDSIKEEGGDGEE